MNILAAPTPAAWVDAACEHWRELLIDHANCEKKAASSALALIFAYPEDRELSAALSRLGREDQNRRSHEGSGPMRATLALMRRIAVELRDQGSYTSFTADTLSYAETNRLLER